MAPRGQETYSWMERILALKSVAVVAVLIMAVLGSIYMRIATVTEEASLSVLAAVLFTWGNRTLGWGTLLECLLAAVKTTSLIILIVMGASFLSRAMGILGIPRE
jgi:C4-dicarboxylate transporter DctM subunit